MLSINTEESSHEIFNIKRDLDCSRENASRLTLLEYGFEIHALVSHYS